MDGQIPTSKDEIKIKLDNIKESVVDMSHIGKRMRELSEWETWRVHLRAGLHQHTEGAH